MGLFISRQTNSAPVQAELERALTMDRMPEQAAQDEAASRAPSAAASAATGTIQVHGGRIVGAFLLFAILVAAAVFADHYKWVSDPKYLYGFASTVLGIIVGFLGGEGVGGASSA